MKDLQEKRIFELVSVSDMFPPLNVFVPTIDEDGEIAMYRLVEHRGELGNEYVAWNMRDGMARNSPNNNKAIIHWLKEVSKLTFSKEELIGLLKECFDHCWIKMFEAENSIEQHGIKDNEFNLFLTSKGL